MTTLRVLTAAGFALLAAPAQAHHSAAIFYGEGAEPIELVGEVTAFRFRNPHAIVELTVTNEDGSQEHWVGETSSPSTLRKRGWSQETLTAGEIVTVQGVQAADGTRLFRITGVTRSDGTPIEVSSRRDD